MFCSRVSVMQAHAWIALGNMCLLDESLAKKNILNFVDTLHLAESPAVSSPNQGTIVPSDNALCIAIPVRWLILSCKRYHQFNHQPELKKSDN